MSVKMYVIFLAIFESNFTPLNKISDVLIYFDSRIDFPYKETGAHISKRT